MWKPDDTNQDGSQKRGGIAAAYPLERGEENYLYPAFAAVGLTTEILQGLRFARAGKRSRSTQYLLSTAAAFSLS